MATIILVHGAWHDASCWRHLTPLLEAAGLRVLHPDLPGHGQSELPASRSTMKAYVSAIKELILSCDEPVYLLGHSMAGMIITAVAAALPERIRQLIYLCAYLPQSGDSVFSLITRIREHEPLVPIELAMQLSADKRSYSVDADSIVPLFYNTCDPAIAHKASGQFTAQGSLPLAAEVAFDPSALASLPMHYVVCQRDRVIPAHHQRRMATQYSNAQLHYVDSDHSPFYSQPTVLAELLLSILAS